MFGYIRMFKPQLNEEDYQIYRGVYCTLCKNLGKKYGLIARLSLSYDFVFLAIFKMGLEENTFSFCNSHCVYNPFKKCLYCQNKEIMDYVTDLSIIMLYNKIADDYQDSTGIKKCFVHILKFVLRKKYQKAYRLLPLEGQWCEEYIKKQSQIETNNEATLDALCDPTAQFLGNLCCSYDKENKNSDNLYRFGYCLGRYIYQIDAIDDIMKDMKHNEFNPYISLYSLNKETPLSSQVKEDILKSTNMTLAELVESYRKLSINLYDSVLGNVLFYGMPKVLKYTIYGKGEKKNARSL